MQDWSWQETDGIPYLTSGLLQDWCHGFFTCSSYPAKPEQLSEVFQAAVATLNSKSPQSLQGIETHRTQQVHGNQVLWADTLVPVTQGEGGTLPQADGILVNPQQHSDALVGGWVASADCTPVLIGDRQTGQVAALHAGWRGTAAQIVPRAIQALRDRGSRLENLCVAMGPAIAGAMYQVDQSVALKVCQTLTPIKLTSDNLWDTLEAPRAPLATPLLTPDPEPGKVRLDVRQVNRRQLLQLGLQETQISIAPYCTYQDSDRFFSYRRTQEKSVQWSGILTHAGWWRDRQSSLEQGPS